MIKYLILALTFTSSSFMLKNSINNEFWLVKPTSGLIVQGTSNVNSFSCRVPSIGCFDTISIVKETNRSEFYLNSELNVSLHLFDCGNKLMTKDLLKTLKASQYPHMKIAFNKMNKNLSALQNSSEVIITSIIELAGVSKKMDLHFTTRCINQSKIELIGQKVICFSDFGLKPPTKMAGTIRVRDQLDVELKMLLEKQIVI